MKKLLRVLLFTGLSLSAKAARRFVEEGASVIVNDLHATG